MFSFVTVVHEIFIIVCSQKFFKVYFTLLHFFIALFGSKLKINTQTKTLVENVVLNITLVLWVFTFECTIQIHLCKGTKFRTIFVLIKKSA